MAATALDAAGRAAAREAIDDEARSALAGCRSLIRNERDVCRVSALARRDSRRAQAAWQHSGRLADWRAWARIDAMGQFEVDKQVCDEPAPRSRQECIDDAASRRDAALRRAASASAPALRDGR